VERSHPGCGEKTLSFKIWRPFSKSKDFHTFS
jgi:hypothetical protein